MSDQTGNPDGQITFADASKPQLEAGKYELTATQTLTVMESLADLLGLDAALAPGTGQIAQILNGRRADGSALLEPTPGAARGQFLVLYGVPSTRQATPQELANVGAGLRADGNEQPLGHVSQGLSASLVAGTINFPAKKVFYVQGPRFRLAGDEIYAQYPPDGQTGSYHETLPHVICRRKTLPWERKLEPNAAEQLPLPWMALLIFDEDEIAENAFRAVSFAEIVTPKDTTIRGPQITLDPWEQPRPADPNQPDRNLGLSLDISWNLFRKVAPRISDLPYLAHARKVPTGSKEDHPGIGDGWFSVILANRQPTNEKRNFAVLVSLEGHQALLAEPEPPAPAAIIRLAVLAKWAFNATGETFEKQVRNVISQDLWLRVSDGNGLPVSVHDALMLGYVPLPHHLRNGDRSVSWYRGPGSPVPIAPRARNLIFENADMALQYDTDRRMLDASIAAAWQLGRLLALQAPEFVRTLSAWEHGDIAGEVLREAQAKLVELFPGQAFDRAQAELLPQDDLMTALALGWTD